VTLGDFIMNSVIERVDLKAVSDELRSAVENEDSGILLRADRYASINGQPSQDGNTYFQLTAGNYRKEFITIWGLFDERKLFHSCMAALSQTACEIREKTPYDIIVTCTPTAKELAAYIHSAVEEYGPVTVRHFGDYPSLNFSYNEMSAFRNQRILIVTDVIATDTLVKRLGELVNRLGGTVKAVLTIFDTKERTHQEMSHEFSLPIINVGSADKDNKVLIYPLAYWPITTYDRVPEDAKTLKIDLSVLPELPIEENGPIRSMITEKQAMHQFDESDAIDFGFFSAGPVGFTIGLRLDRILDTQGDKIWKHVKPLIISNSIIVTSFAKEDLRFFDFVVARAQKEPIDINKTMLIMKRGDSMAIPRLFCSRIDCELSHMNIILLISTAISSLKLENLVSLLATEKAQSIKVICLVNRMGYHTTRFVKTIHKLLMGINSEKEDGCCCDKGGRGNHTDFEFLPVFEVTDLPSDDLSTMHSVIGSKIDRYRSRMNNHSILSLFADKFAHRFESRTVNDRRFSSGKKTFSSDKGSREHSSVEFKTWLMTYDLVAHRNYDPLLDGIKNEEDTRALYHYFGLVISDHNLARIRRRVDRVVNVTINRLHALRRERIQLEKARSATMSDESLVDSVKKAIEIEVALLTGLSLLSDFVESNRFDARFFLDFLYVGLNADEWLDLPVNLTCHFTDERIACLFAMLIYTFHPNLRESDVQKELKTNIFKKSRDLVRAFDKIQNDTRFGDVESTRQALFQKIKTFVDLVHHVIDIHGPQEKHQVIRYLFRWILKWNDRHNPLIMELDKALNSFGGLFDLREDIHEYTRKQIVSKEMLQRIDEAIEATNILLELGRFMRTFYMFTPSTLERHNRFMVEEYTEGYARDVFTLRDILSDVRNRKSISLEDRNTMAHLKMKIKSDFYDGTSPLRESLSSYIVPFISELLRNLKYCSEMLNNLGMGDVWVNEIKAIGEQFPKSENSELRASDWDVLIDPYLFQNTLRNILYNVRHAFDEPISPGIEKRTNKAFSELVKIKISMVKKNLEREDSMKVFTQLDVMAQGKSFRARDLADRATFASQQEQIREYGGDLRIHEKPEDGFSNQVTLQLLRRD
jgi:orotate phosphoribosyltransferase